MTWAVSLSVLLEARGKSGTQRLLRCLHQRSQHIINDVCCYFRCNLSAPGPGSKQNLLCRIVMVACKTPS